MTPKPKALSLADIRKAVAILRRQPAVTPKPLSMDDARANNRNALRKRRPKLCISVGTECYYVGPMRGGR